LRRPPIGVVERSRSRKTCANWTRKARRILSHPPPASPQRLTAEAARGAGRVRAIRGVQSAVSGRDGDVSRFGAGSHV